MKASCWSDSWSHSWSSCTCWKVCYLSWTTWLCTGCLWYRCLYLWAGMWECETNYKNVSFSWMSRNWSVCGTMWDSVLNAHLCNTCIALNQVQISFRRSCSRHLREYPSLEFRRSVFLETDLITTLDRDLRWRCSQGLKKRDLAIPADWQFESRVDRYLESLMSNFDAFVML